MNEQIKAITTKIDEINKNTRELIDNSSVPSPLKNEFNLKTSQYYGMIEDLETMLALSDKPDTIENLHQQEVEVLKTRIEWEKDILRRVSKYI